jgi:hypothetical protein
MARALFLLTLAAIALGGCAQRWTKPGATEADFKIAQLRCESHGYQRLPAELFWTQVSAGYYAPGYRNCRKSHGSRRCESRPGHYVPARYGHVDRNEAARDRFVALCLADNGWRPVD